MKRYEFRAKTVEKAIELGLAELGKSKFDVDIKILESGGLFKKAVVQISFEDEKELSVNNEAKVENNQQAVVDNESVLASDVVDDKVENDKQAMQEDMPSNEQVNDEQVNDEPVEQADNQLNETKKERKYSNNVGSKLFIENLLKNMKVDATVEIEEQEEHTKAYISTEQAGAVIGYRGECLSAIQYLANIVEQKKNKTAKRLIVDVADYRERRDDSLKDMADRMARKVLKMRKAIKLKPMNAYDRRIIHSYLQKFEGVTTHSVGVEPHRCLIIDVKRD